MKLDELSKIVAGNGDLKEGLMWKTEQLEKDMLTMKGTLYALEKTSTENNALLKAMANNKPNKKILGVSPQARERAWIAFSRVITIGIASWLGVDAFVK